jgi:hypothetical protein
MSDRGYPRGDERCQTTAGLPRLMCTPSHSPEQMPVQRVLPAVEVRGGEIEPSMKELGTDRVAERETFI